MDVAVSEAKGQLTELVRRAQAGEEVVLTRFGRPVVRLVPMVAAKTAADRCAAIEAALRDVGSRALPGPSAERSQDFLYDDETGLPQ